MQIKDVIIFTTGLAIGAAGSFFVTKKLVSDKLEEKFEAQYQKDLESVKESFAELAEKDKKRAEAAKEKPPLEIYAQALNKVKEREAGKVNYSNIATAEEEEEVADEDTPLIDTTLIDETTDTSQPYALKRWPTASESEYTQLEVTYYADGTYADSMDTEMEIEEYIGRNMMDYVANTDKDEVYIRNDELCLDIDIRKDVRTYDEVMFG